MTHDDGFHAWTMGVDSPPVMCSGVGEQDMCCLPLRVPTELSQDAQVLAEKAMSVVRGE